MTKKGQSKIDLNTVDENVLIRKLNISPRLAKRVIAQRPYQSIEDLKKVWGIDPQTLQRILLLVSVKSKIISEPAKPVTPAQPEIAITCSAAPVETAPVQDIAPIPQAEPARLELQQADMAVPPEERMLQTEAAIPPEEQKQQVELEASHNSAKTWVLNLGLLLILLVGAYFRFTGLNWDENHHQHPDERFITMVASELKGVNGAGEYFNTANSTLNPLKHGSYTYGMLPLFITRTVAEWLKMSDYDPITLVGRAMSGMFDLAAIWMLYILGKRLYSKRIGILAAILYAAAVLPIQLSHFFAVDSFSTVFVIASLYYATLAIPLPKTEAKLDSSKLVYHGLFGIAVGLAGACKVNTLPMFGVTILAGIAWLIAHWREGELRNHLYPILLGWAFALLMAFLTFRIFQPYAFNGPGFFGFSLNPKWLDVIREVTNQVAGKSEWPPNHHWTDRPFTYGWTNMVTWGLGLPLGLAAWAGWLWAGWRIWKGDWRSHLLPFIWIAGYFFWQNSQFWRYMRYFLPIYPFLVLFAAWALWELFDRTQESRKKLLTNGLKFSRQLADFRQIWRGSAALLALGIVVLGTYGYAIAFTRIYTKPMTRITASRWMLSNIAGPLNLIVETTQGQRSYPILIDNRFIVVPGTSPTIQLHIPQNGTASTITSTNIRQLGVNLYFRISRDEEGKDIVTQGSLSLSDDAPDSKQILTFGDIELSQDNIYYLYFEIHNSNQITISGMQLGADKPEDPTMPVEWDVRNQAAGVLEKTLQIKPTEAIKLNRLTFDQFQQVFVPSATTLKISLFKEGDEQNPLAETSQTLNFSQPGMTLSPEFHFNPIQISGGKITRVRYEIISGGPLTIHGEPYTLETSWDDALPLSVDHFDGLGGIYSPLNLELYEPDTPGKREAMIQVLSNSQYIVIPSNRAYDAMPRLPLRYPMTLKYYQALFGCNCSGDALENRAYQLTPPFKSPLGFDLVATFESPPSFGPWSINDQSADESFTVYDHPKVLVFKKSEDFSIEHVKTLLNSVDLDQIIFQTPLGYTQAPTAMELPAGRLAAQTNGGSWSAMFNRAAWLNTNDLAAGIIWYLTLLLLGWMVFPFLLLVFPGLPDRGYTLMRMAGLITIAWLTWFLGSLQILPFTRLTIGLCIGLILILNAALAMRNRKQLAEFIHSKWKHLLGMEFLFLALFLFCLYVRLGNPDIWHPWHGGEKPMDFAFFNAVLKAVYFPPENPWFSGHYINYYYYGYVFASIPTKLLGILPSIAYNLTLPSWFAMIGCGIFGLAFNLFAGFRSTGWESQFKPTEENKFFQRVLRRVYNSGKVFPYLAGAVALVAILFFGNLYIVREFWKYLPELTSSSETVNGPIERAGAVIGGAVQVLTGVADLPGGNDRWYFEASRPILHDGPDTPIAEFPYFTFLYGDLHAHLLTMPIYALALGWILSLLLFPLLGMRLLERIATLFFGALVFGSFLASHTWDFPTFVGLACLVILWEILRNRTGSVQHTIQMVISYDLTFLAAAVTLYWPFRYWFHTEYASLELWKGARTPLTDYLFVWGLPLFVMTSLLLRNLGPEFRSAYQRWITTPRQARITWRRIEPYVLFLIVAGPITLLWISDYQVVAFGVLYIAGMLYLIFLKRGLTFLQRIIWILFGVGLSLTMAVEVVVLKGDVGRSNMVFRFYDQAWFIFGLAISVALIDLLSGISHWPRRARLAWISALALLSLGAACYPLIATGRRMNDRWPDIQNPPHTLDGAKYMLGEANDITGQIPAIYNDEDRKINLAHDYAGIQYMQDHIAGSPVIVEGHTEEYRWGSRYSIYTGLPSVIGWSWHIRQQNTLLDGSFIEKRINDVNDFYNSPDIQAAKLFLERYHVQYIILSDLERTYYSAEGLAKFQAMVEQGILQMVYGDNTPNTATILKVMLKE